MLQELESDSEFVTHTPCEKCGSSDANSLYTDGHTYCFSCQAHVQGQEEAGSFDVFEDPTIDLIEGSWTNLDSRKISYQTCKKFDYRVGQYKGKAVQIANYRNDKGQVVAQKIRDKDKNFSILGNGKGMTLFGSHRWRTGKKIIICEGEIDAMSVAQVIKSPSWACVSLPNGAPSAKKSIKRNWDYLLGFEEIVLCFDQDEPGQAAAQECAEVLPLGKTSIVTLPHNHDANELLVRGEEHELVKAIFNAKPYRPDGVIAALDLRSEIAQTDAASDVCYPFARLNEISKGLRTSSLVTIAAGSGVGKSTLVREIFYHLHRQNQKCGMIMLEETTKRTLQGLVGLHLNKNITVDYEAATEDEIKGGFDDLFTQDHQIYLYDHWGSNDFETILNRIRYMAQVLECKWVCLDHVSILVSALTGNVSDERRLIDEVMTRLRTLVQEVDIGMILVSHLKRPQSEAGHEGGAKVHLSQLRGSHALAQLADQCIGLEIDAEDPTSDTRNIVMLKNRFTGEVGFAGTLKYNRETGRLIDTDDMTVSPF